jgi:hypothetical protein
LHLLKILALLFLLIFSKTNCFSQNLRLQLHGNSAYENKLIDSLGYRSTHTTTKEIDDEIQYMFQKLTKIGFVDSKIIEQERTYQRNYTIRFSLGNRITLLHIYIGTQKPNTDQTISEIKEQAAQRTAIPPDRLRKILGVEKNKDTLIIPYTEVETFLNTTLKKLEKNGFELATLQLVTIEKIKNTFRADLQLNHADKRILNEIVIRYDENANPNFPIGHIKQLHKKYSNRTVNQDLLSKISTDFDKFGFVTKIKSPELLFTKDSTKLYVYLAQRKSNTFDGFIGFANNASNTIRFNGYLDVALSNVLHAGEQFVLYWKSDGNQQRTFKTSIDLPYLFKSPLGLKAQINIFKQDSLFQNTKTAIDLGYLIDYNTRFYIGYQSTESSDIQNINTTSISDFTNYFLSTSLEYKNLDTDTMNFPEKTIVSIQVGTGSRSTNSSATTVGNSKQTFVNIHAMHNFYLNSKNCFNINYQNFYLKSDSYIINELYRFGGTKTIRGFAENSFQANLMIALMTEYRYIIAPDLYIHTIFDYGYYEDQTSNAISNLLGMGMGIGVRTKNGLLKLNLSNGTSTSQKILFTQTFVNVTYNLNF